MQTPAGASSLAGRGRGKTNRGARGGRGGGRVRKAAAPSSPPPPADSPDHRSAPSQVDPSDLDPSRTPVHEPRVDERRADEPRVDEHRDTEPSSHETPELSRDHAESQRDPWADSTESSGRAAGGYGSDSYSEGEWVEGRKVYQRGGTKLPPIPATPDQRWLIAPQGDK